MEEKELNTLLEQVDQKAQTAAKAAADEAVKGLLKADELQAKLEELQIDGKSIKEIVEAVIKQGEKINEIETRKVDRKETVKEIMAKEFPKISKSINENGGSYKFRMPSGYIGKTTVALTSITSDPVGMIVPGVAEIQSQANRIAPSLNRFQLTPDDHGVIYWTDMTTRTNNAAARSDGSAAAEQVYAWTGYSETVDNISAMIPVHKEALKHISFMQGELERLLRDDCAVALDGYCYTGSGTAPQIGGLYTRATAFDAAAYIAAGGFTPVRANIYDLIVSMAAQIMKATKYNVDRAWINPYDALKMKLNKDANGVYTMPPFVVPGPNGPVTVSNMTIIEANSVTAGTLVVGDSSKATLYDNGVEIEVGYNLTGDFSKRILTILANMECSLLIRNAEVDAFLKSENIDSDVAAITYSGS